jgi:hypothetical protein
MGPFLRLIVGSVLSGQLAFGQNQPISVLNYGARSDARIVTDGAMSSGSSVLSSASTPWSSCPKGKTVSVQYAGGIGGSNQPLVTTVLSCTDTGHIVLAANATQNVSAAGVIWGTDNYSAFNSWVETLPGNRGIIPCPTAGRAYLINLQGEKVTLNLASNEYISMNQSCAIDLVGAHIGTEGGLFNIPAGSTNIVLDSLHVVGEWQNQSSLTGIRQGYGDGTVIYSENKGGSSNIQVLKPLFSNLLGMGVKEFNANDTNVVVKDGRFLNSADTALNVNSASSTLDNNLCQNTSAGGGGCIEAGGAQSHYTNNKSYYATYNYAMQFGGITSGSPYVGSEVVGNRVYFPLSSQGCFSIADGFTHGIISHNFCHGSFAGGRFGFVSVQSGSIAVGNNLYDSNIAESTSHGTGFYFAASNGNLLKNNSSIGFDSGLIAYHSTGILGSANTWNSNGIGRDITVDLNSSASLRDRSQNCTIALGSGRTAGTFSNDTLIANDTRTCYSALHMLPGHESSGSPTTVPRN